MYNIRYYVLFDLNKVDLETQIAIRLNELDNNIYQGCYLSIEKTHFDNNIPKYTLIILASRIPLSKKELINALSQMKDVPRGGWTKI